MAQNFVAQPDFTSAAQSMRATADEIEKCSNLPAISEGTGIVNAIQAQIQALEARLSTQIAIQIQASEARQSALIHAQSALIQAQSTELRILSSQVLASEHNNAARLQNKMLHTSGAPLTILHDMENNPINSFPLTPAALQQLGGPQLGELLVALSLPNDGSAAQKRLRLRVAVGLRDISAP